MARAVHSLFRARGDASCHAAHYSDGVYRSIITITITNNTTATIDNRMHEYDEKKQSSITRRTFARIVRYEARYSRRCRVVPRRTFRCNAIGNTPFSRRKSIGGRQSIRHYRVIGREAIVSNFVVTTRERYSQRVAPGQVRVILVIFIRRVRHDVYARRNAAEETIPTVVVALLCVRKRRGVPFFCRR